MGIRCTCQQVGTDFGDSSVKLLRWNRAANQTALLRNRDVKRGTRHEQVPRLPQAAGVVQQQGNYCGWKSEAQLADGKARVLSCHYHLAGERKPEARTQRPPVHTGHHGLSSIHQASHDRLVGRERRALCAAEGFPFAGQVQPCAESTPFACKHYHPHTRIDQGFRQGGIKCLGQGPIQCVVPRWPIQGDSGYRTFAPNGDEHVHSLSWKSEQLRQMVRLAGHHLPYLPFLEDETPLFR
jgi:hypothetical protein